MLKVIKNCNSNTLIEQGKCLGERWRMVVPPQLAYGDQGTGDIIPPAATLTFEVRLVQINQDWWQPGTAGDTEPGVNIFPLIIDGTYPLLRAGPRGGG